MTDRLDVLMQGEKRTIVATGIVLVLVSLSSVSLLILGFGSYLNFENPYSYVPTTPQSSIVGTGMIPLANHTVVFVLDGVRADTFYETNKPHIEALSDWANYTDVECSTFLSLSRPGQGVISSGVNTSESKVMSNDYEGLFTADSLWSTAIRNSATTAVVGSDGWFELFEPWLNYSMTFTNTHTGEATSLINKTGTELHQVSLPEYQDSLVAEYAGLVVESHTPTLMVVHFSDTDTAGHANGTTSESYITALKNEDTYIGEVIRALSDAGVLKSTLIVITSDHGQIDAIPGKGQHGGTEPEVLHTPLLIRGPGIEAGLYESSAHQNSIAPTVASVMGWEIPSDASGTVLFDCINFSSMQEAIYRINLAQIRHRQASARAAKMDHLKLVQDQITRAGSYLSDALLSFDISDYSSAITDAISSESESRTVLSIAWKSKIQQEISARTGLSAIVILLLAGLLFFLGREPNSPLRRIGDDRVGLAATIVAAAAYLAVFYAVVAVSGWTFSVSTIATSVEGYVMKAFLPPLIGIVFGTAVLVLTERQLRGSNQREVESVARTSQFIALTILIQFGVVLIFVVRNGPGLPWYATGVEEQLLYFFLGISTIAFVLYGVIIILACLSISRLQNRRQT